MDQIFSIGKNLIGGGGDSGSSGLGGIGDALTLFKQLDRNGDGKITEDGNFFYFNLGNFTKKKFKKT